MATQKEKAAELRWEALHLLNMALAFPEDSVHDGELEKTFAKVELKLGTSRKLMAEAISSGSKDGRATFCNIPDLFEFASQEDLDQELHARSHITTQDLSPKVAVMSLSVAHSSLFISTTPPP